MKSVVCTLLMGLMFSFSYGTYQTWADKIVFVCHRGEGVGGEDEICTVNPDGGQRRTLTKKPPDVIKKLACLVTQIEPRVLFATFIPSGLYLMDADSGNLRLLKEEYRGVPSCLVSKWTANCLWRNWSVDYYFRCPYKKRGTNVCSGRSSP